MSETGSTCRACGSPAKEGSPLCSTCWGKLPELVQRKVDGERAQAEAPEHSPSELKILRAILRRMCVASRELVHPQQISWDGWERFNDLVSIAEEVLGGEGEAGAEESEVVEGEKKGKR